MLAASRSQNLFLLEDVTADTSSSLQLRRHAQSSPECLSVSRAGAPESLSLSIDLIRLQDRHGTAHLQRVRRRSRRPPSAENIFTG